MEVFTILRRILQSSIEVFGKELVKTSAKQSKQKNKNIPDRGRKMFKKENTTHDMITNLLKNNYIVITISMLNTTDDF